MQLTPLHGAILIAVTFLWGMNFAAAKIGLEYFPPIFMMALRWGLLGLMLAPLVPLPHGHWRQVILVSFTLGLLHFSFMFWGLQELDAATAAIAIQLQVPFAAMLAAVIYKDMLGWWRAGGMAVAFLGVAVIAGEPRLDGHYLALGMVILAACLWSVANMQIKSMGQINGMTLNAWIGIFATPQLALVSFLMEEGQYASLLAADLRAYTSLAYQAIVVVVVGYGIWFRMLRRYQVNQVMPFILLVPIFGVLSGVVVLGEVLTVTLIAGGLLTILGVGIIMFRRPKLISPEAKRM